ncbi:hypothetical protein [Paenibacillus periandrae]|uniref:hypothetical protein n=1 Tax=Paenibacillus periandrae TaxID=1761741 RepID=UPI001F08D3D1|nr:hypothetical protein [Paenibacillus periandrae]
MDSGYTGEKVINACNRKGFHIIAVVKTNQLILLPNTFTSLTSAPLQWSVRERTGFMNMKNP